MANAKYLKGNEGFLDGSIDWDTDNITAVLIDTDLYTFDEAHENRDEVAAGAQVATANANITSPTVTGGLAGSAKITFDSVSGATCEAMIIYKNTGLASTDRLIAYIDTAENLPVTPNGGEINVTAPNGWFYLR